MAATDITATGTTQAKPLLQVSKAALNRTVRRATQAALHQAPPKIPILRQLTTELAAPESSLKSPSFKPLEHATTSVASFAPPGESSATNALAMEVDISFVTDKEIAVLNADYRNKPRPTDVLSFAQSEGEAFPTGPFSTKTAATSTAASGEASDGFAAFDGFAASERDSFSLGDIVISIETAARQACERDHDLETEVSFLVVHGALHLLGYDHATSSQRRAMWKQQDAIVARLSPMPK